MVYTRLIFNNVRESTPSEIPTRSFDQMRLPPLGRGQFVGWRMHRDPKYVRLYRFVYRFFCKPTLGRVVLCWAFAYGLTSVLLYPGLYLYRLNNQHRTLEAALRVENAYKKRKAQEEAAEEAEEEEEEDSAPPEDAEE